MANSVDPDQTAPLGAVRSGSTLFASLLNSSIMLGNYLQQTTSTDDIFRCIFSWRFKGLYFYCHLLIFFFKINFFKNSFRNNIRVPNSLYSIRTRVLLVLIWVQIFSKLINRQ